MASNSPSSRSSVSSKTATEAMDAESLRMRPQTGHFSLVFRPSGINAETLNHPYWGDGTEDSPFVVDFLPVDAYNPTTYPGWKKWCITLLHAFATLAVSFVSSAYSGGAAEIIKEFHVSTTVSILGISLFVVGFAVGPLIWAPLSGKWASAPSFFLFVFFCFPPNPNYILLRLLHYPLTSLGTRTRTHTHTTH